MGTTGVASTAITGNVVSSPSGFQEHCPLELAGMPTVVLDEQDSQKSHNTACDFNYAFATQVPPTSKDTKDFPFFGNLLDDISRLS